ncbi:hypothetical protein C8F01DRAFT_1246705 [Mycena amicta]|nr:hypothetical protein C8F01DRAFT_1246705 [Mycena amicta]
MQQPPSVLRAWRKRRRPQTSPAQASAPAIVDLAPSRSSNATPLSPKSSAFFRAFKTNHFGGSVSSLEDWTKTQKRVSLRLNADHSPHADEPPSSPSPFDRPLPSVPPRRPPRPPSLNLELDLESSSPLRARRAEPRAISSPRRRPPQLDNTWAGFLRDTEEDDDFVPRVHLTRRSNASNPTLVRSKVSEPAPRIDCHSESDSESSPEWSSPSTHFPLSLFPSPPPLRARRPAPLILRPTPTIAPLPPSPGFNSNDSTPVATPTTPKYPLSILKRTRRPVSPPSTPPASPLPPAPVMQSPRPLLRSAQSVPHLQLIASSHRNTSSDTIGQRRRPLPQPHKDASSLTPDNRNVQWGYAI